MKTLAPLLLCFLLFGCNASKMSPEIPREEPEAAEAAKAEQADLQRWTKAINEWERQHLLLPDKEGVIHPCKSADDCDPGKSIIHGCNSPHGCAPPPQKAPVI